MHPLESTTEKKKKNIKEKKKKVNLHPLEVDEHIRKVSM